MKDFHDSVKFLDLIEGVNTWRKTIMKAEDAALNVGGQRLVIEQIKVNVTVDKINVTVDILGLNIPESEIPCPVFLPYD